MADTLVQLEAQRWKQLSGDRGEWLNHWQDLADYLHPRRADFTLSRIEGSKRTEKQFDGTPARAARDLAAALDAMLMPQNSPWAEVKAADDEINDNREAKLWLDDANEILWDEMHDPRARFFQARGEVNLDLVAFGTGGMFVGENLRDGHLMFRSQHLRDLTIAVSEEGTIDTVYVSARLTARQAAQRFGEQNLGEKAKEALTRDQGKDRDKKFTYLRVVKPRRDRDRSRVDNRNLPFAAIDIEVESEHLINESGFHEFPYIIPRWETASAEVYGRGPGMLALPDTKTLNQMGKTILRAGHKAVDPPMMLPSDSLRSTLRTAPGGVFYVDFSQFQGITGRIPFGPVETGKNLPLGREMQNDIREQIWAAFFRNVLNLPVDGPQMTATEVMVRREEFMRVIGPVFGRLESDYTGPLVRRVFALLFRRGRFPEPPDILRGQGLKFEYASPITKAAKLIEVAALGKTLEDLGPLIAVKSDMLDWYDTDKMAVEIPEANGLPQDWLRDERAVQGLRQQRAEAAQAEKVAADMERMAQAAPDVAGAIKDISAAQQV